MSLHRTALPLLLFAGLLLACNDAPKRKPLAVGGESEVLVVMAKGHWEGEPGAAVRQVLEQYMEHMPQPEKRFKVAQCAPEHFASLLEGHHRLGYLRAMARDGESLQETHKVWICRHVSAT